MASLPRCGSMRIFLLIISFLCIVSIVWNFLDSNQIRENDVVIYDTSLANTATAARPIQQETTVKLNHHHHQQQQQQQQQQEQQHEQQQQQKQQASPPPFAGSLDCSAHGGPSNELAAEMVYWSDIPSDKAFKSPFYPKNDDVNNNNAETTNKKYLTFEWDFAGFNNMRMSFETIVLLAHSMGRTLVLPPSNKVQWLNWLNDENKRFSFSDVYDLDKIRSEHAGLDIVTTDQFLTSEGLTGNLIDKESGKPRYPPDNRTDWNAVDKKILEQYLRSVSYNPPKWEPAQCLASFPNGTESWHYPVMKWFLRNATNSFNGPYPTFKEYYNNPSATAVTDPPEKRMREAIVGGYGGPIRRLCLYDETIVEKHVVHFPCCMKETRLLTHHYSFLFFWDWAHDLWTKRFVRDNLRYRDVIQCAAARVVTALRNRARSRDVANNPHGEYDSFHIRRGDLIVQFKNTGVSAEEIHRNSKGELTANATVFVATDHSDRDFFAPLASTYDLVFLDDFKEELEGVDKMYYGMIDQLVASRGRVFFGCYQSTFSNFIFRIRAWRIQKDKLEGYKDGILDDSFYYIQPNKTYEYRTYSAMSPPTYMREWPVAWKNMDEGIGQLNRFDG
mmetsp:Transcript_2927/g.6397  ORF Transcript_2927/g.6397 Transcript_2927/m.6397 type:complete len:615 (+) Transcript_2927:85-1929(+)|eukprot:CAMPEP_0183715714 /NCGR_PEP_ID=MMETSP0737-20130205/9841_1 /TAXON_ID=385413 /ORGANISM="Thalassiosira miniscula, Strain CCMP1093" /LENGTH=614 /DNA_ID=CAMNT_0025944845 /DNA_START=52 /DNA_END=1896 /DNA_ORIENTATION=-